MSNPSPEDINQTPHRIFTEQVCMAIQQRMVGGRPLAVDLVNELALYRFTGAQTAEPPGITPTLLTRSQSFRQVTTFAQLLQSPIAAALQALGLLGESRAAIPLLAISACGLASRLLEQLGLQDPAIVDYNRRLPELKALLQEGLSTATEVTLTANACVAKTVEAFRRQLTLCAEKKSSALAVLRFFGQGPAFWVEGLTPSGDPAISMPLHDFVASFITPAAEGVAGQLHRERPTWERQQHRGMGILSDICPSLADALRLALQDSRPVGIRLCIGRSRRGLPLDVWFYVSPGDGCCFRGCVLSVNRPHGDFVLEAADGSYYYFPPCLLSARFNFMTWLPQVEYPIVRQPVGGYNWCHPYTGTLGAGIFAGAKLLHSEDEILDAPSEPAIAIFPQLQRRTQAPAENNLCLGGQAQIVPSIQEKLRSAHASLHEPDVLAAVTVLHDIAKLGLTRGHQDNTAGPRARLQSDSMPYPLRGRQFTGVLAKRTFAFRSDGISSRATSTISPTAPPARPVRRAATRPQPSSSRLRIPDPSEIARILERIEARRYR